MNIRPPAIAISALCLAIVATQGTVAQTKPPTKVKAKVTYTQVQNILTKNCVSCHGDRRAKEGIRLTNFKNVMAGGEHGPIVVAGNPEKSMLIKVLNGTKGVKQMPWREAPLSAADVATISAWIKSGAKPK